MNRSIRISIALLLGLCACTGQLPGTFRYKQVLQAFSTKQEVNTKIDLLWVVDNSSSMDVSQTKLRKGFAQFANAYLKPYWDIRIAVIPTDLYIANPAFDNYVTGNLVLDKNVAEQVQPAHLKNLIETRIANFGIANPAADPILSKLAPYVSVLNDGTAGKFRQDGGGNPYITLGALVPPWLQRANYAKLIAGIHDGPIGGFCSSAVLLPYFFNTSITHCQVRDAGISVVGSADTGTSKCLDPLQNGAEQCVNTFANDTVHSGLPIISTKTPVGTAEAVWSQTVINAFMVNATTGSAGHGSERAFSSVLEFIRVNEADADPNLHFFRKDSLHGIVFVADEDDQSTELPVAPMQIANPFADYKCDQAQLVAFNPASAADITNSYCCSTLNPDGSAKCRYGKRGTSCDIKNIEGTSWTVSVCPDTSLLLPVSTFNSRLLDFFNTIDGKAAGSANTNYFITAIVPQSLQSVRDLQTLRDTSDTQVNTYKNQAVDRGDRFLSLVNLVGNSSLSLELGDANYDRLLDDIGRTLVSKKSTFYLQREPTGFEEMVVKVVHQDGSSSVIPASKLSLTGKILVITDTALVLSLKDTDQISVDYQPKFAT